MTDVVALLDRPWRILALAVVASAGLVAGAHFFETVVGLPPCPLCQDQREAHWTAIGLAALGLGAMRASSAAPIGAAALGALALVYGFSAVLAGYHAGVEWRFWPGPATCGGGGAIDIDPAVLLDALDETPGPVSCADAPWRLLGVSMAGYNALFSAALFAVAGVGAVRFANREDRS